MHKISANIISNFYNSYNIFPTDVRERNPAIANGLWSKSPKRNYNFENNIKGYT